MGVETPPIFMKDITECPLCKMPVRVVRREDGAADHYEPLTYEETEKLPNPCPPAIADYLRVKRKGKKTVAMLGAGFTTGQWVPFGEVDIWTLNELHDLSWMQEESVSGWYQIHPKWSFTKEHKSNHWEWLQKKHPFPIYMQHVYDDVPCSVMFPLRDIQNGLVNIVRGELPIRKLFSSTFCYAMALALFQGYERIELYGIQLMLEGEYHWQREMMSFWLGKADGMGVEVWLPKQSSLLTAPLYGYEEIKKGDTGRVVNEKQKSLRDNKETPKP